MSTPGLAGSRSFGCADHDTCCIHLIDHAATAGTNRRTGVTGDDRLHAGADKGALRHAPAARPDASCWTPSERTVGVIVFQERNECGRDRNELFRRHVHELDFRGGMHRHIAGLTRDDEFVDELALAIEFGVGLSDGVFRLLPSPRGSAPRPSQRPSRPCGKAFR